MRNVDVETDVADKAFARNTAIGGPWNATMVAMSIIASYAIAMTVLVAAPLELFAIASHRCGTMATDGLHFSACGAPALVAIGAFTLLLSVAIGGWASVVFSHRHLSWPWLAVLTLVTVYGVSVTVERVPNAIDTMHEMSGGDSAKTGAFIGFWVLMVGYASHAVWDEARDRAGAFFSARLNQSHGAGHATRGCPHCQDLLIESPTRDDETG